MLSSFFFWPSTTEHGTSHITLSVVNKPSEIPLEKTNVSFASGYQVEIASWLDIVDIFRVPGSNMIQACYQAKDSKS